MENKKKGFIFYFDNYPILAALPMEQRGMLFSALTIYADQVWQDTSVTLEEVMEGFPQMTREARMACGFMGTAVCRDTLAWLNKREYRIKKKQGQAVSSAQTDQRAREEMERVKRMMDQMKAEG